MKIIIVYASQHGCTERNAQTLKDQLDHDVTLCNVKELKKFDLADFEMIIIGGSIHAGQIQRKIQKFCVNNQELLLTKKLALFVSCMKEDSEADEQFNIAFSEELRNHSVANGIFGGEFNFERMNFIERFLVKKIAKIEKSESKILKENIENFVTKVNSLK